MQKLQKKLNEITTKEKTAPHMAQNLPAYHCSKLY